MFLPIVGWVLLLLPILWSENASTGTGLIYIFTIWAVLIAVVAPISIRLMASLREGDAQRATRSERKDEGDAGRTG